MPKYVEKPVAVEATQWWQNGDHPADGPLDREGLVVRYYRHPDVPGDARHCDLPGTARPNCDRTMHQHGWIDTIEGGHTVCPGDWIITGVRGERYPCEPSIFAETYGPERHGGRPTIVIPTPVVAPLGVPLERPEYVQEVWDTFVKPDQDAGNLQSSEMRMLMAILRSVYEGLDGGK